MKHLSKVLALILALLMLASVMAACGEKTDEGKSANGGSDTASGAESKADTAAVAGEEQTWGEITVLVPDGMELNGGDLADKENKKSVRLLSNDSALNYINITVYDDESNAQSNIDMTKSMNEEYSPTDVNYELNGVTWKGVEYDSFGLHCISAYATVGDKVFYSMSAGYELKDDSNLTAVLASLK